MNEQPVKTTTGIPAYLRLGKASFVLVFALLFFADGLKSGELFMLTFGIGLLAWTSRSPAHDRSIADKRNLGVLILNTACALFVFAFFPDHVRWPAVRWIILALAVYCAVLTVMLGRRQRQSHG